MEEIRNELINIDILNKKMKKKEDTKFYFELLLERFEIDLKRKKQDLEHELEQIKDNLILLEQVKENIK